MSDTFHVRSVAIALLVTVASQIFYVTIVSGSANEMLRPLTWFVELFAFLTITILAIALAARRPEGAAIWVAIGISGLLNLLQVGMGLAMFAPAMKASQSVPQLFSTVLAGAFFLYFLAKLVLGGVAAALGLGFLRQGSGAAKAGGGVLLFGGIAAAGLNLLAMIDAKAWTFPAGGAGTAATALVAIALLLSVRERGMA